MRRLFLSTNKDSIQCIFETYWEDLELIQKTASGLAEYVNDGLGIWSYSLKNRAFVKGYEQDGNFFLLPDYADTLEESVALSKEDYLLFHRMTKEAIINSFGEKHKRRIRHVADCMESEIIANVLLDEAIHDKGTRIIDLIFTKLMLSEIIKQCCLLGHVELHDGFDDDLKSLLIEFNDAKNDAEKESTVGKIMKMQDAFSL